MQEKPRKLPQNTGAALEPEAVDGHVLEVLSGLALAVQRHRIYPPLSPLCEEAVSSCAAAIEVLAAEQALVARLPDAAGATDDLPLADWDSEDPRVPEDADRGPVLKVRVGAGRLFVEAAPVPSTSAIDDLTERLFRADIEEFSVHEGVTEKELGRFSRRLASWERSRGRYVSISEALTVQGVLGVSVRCAERLEVLDFDVLPVGQLDGLRAEREARVAARVEDSESSQATGGPVGGDPRDAEDAGGRQATAAATAELSLQRAWVRVDTDCPLEPIDMLDLAFLIDSQEDLSGMLLGLAQNETESVGAPLALRETVSELIHLYSGLSGEVAEKRFEQLAATLMELDPSLRRTLTRDVLIPDLLQSGKAAQVLRFLPDGEIAEAVRTLVDLDVGGSGLAGLALKRLKLPAERLRGMTRAVRRPAAAHPAASATKPAAEASSQIRLESDHTVFRDMRELAVLDLAVDAPAAKRLRAVRDRVNRFDGTAVHLQVALDLLPHVRNPDRAEEILASVIDPLRGLLSEDHGEASSKIAQLSSLAAQREQADPEIAASISSVLGQLIDLGFVEDQARRFGVEGHSDPALPRLIEVLGPIAATGFLQALEDVEDRQLRRTILTFMCGLADTFSPHLEPYLEDPRWTVVRNAVRVLGFAGPGRESGIAHLLGHHEKRVVREAFLALSRIGTPRAAEEILRQLESSDPRRRGLAEDAIRRFPAAHGEQLTGRLLSQPALYSDRPQVASALIARFMNPPSEEATALLRPLLRLRFWFWRPALCRLGWTAGAALRGGGA